MTVRQQKQIVLVAAVAVALAMALNVVVILRRGWREGLELWPLLFFLVLIWSWWGRLSKLQAEHGPDYQQPGTQLSRRWLVVIAGVLAGIAAVLVVFILARRQG